MESRFETSTNIRPWWIITRIYTSIFKHNLYNWNTKPELCHLPFNDMQSYDIENENENITFIDETNIYSPLHIKNIIKENTS